jgi:AcrR family transcriptional regulator
MATTGSRGQYAKTPQRRQEILDAAFEVFAASGYRGGSLRDIAERVGMSLAGLLHHFTTKSELLWSVLTLRDDTTAREFGALDESASGDQILRSYLRLIVGNESERGLAELYCILSAEATAPDHPAHDYFIQRYKIVTGIVERAFEDVATQGKLRPGVDPHEAAIDLIAMSDGIQLQWLLRPEVPSMGDSVRRYLESVTTLEFSDDPHPVR